MGVRAQDTRLGSRSAGARGAAVVQMPPRRGWPLQQTLNLQAEAGPGGEPVLFKDGAFAVPLTLAVNAVAPALVSVLCLYGITALYDVPFDRAFSALAALVVLLSLVLLQPPRRLVSQLLMPRSAIARTVLSRWAMLLGVLLAAGYLTQYSEEYSRRVLATWALVTPAVLMAVTFSLHELVRRLMGSPALVQKIVFVGCNDVSCTLAQRLRLHPELCMSVVGFFDDRSRARLGAHGRGRMLGALRDLETYVRAHPVDAIYIALPLRDVFRVQEVLRRLQDTTVSVYYLPDVPVSSSAAGLVPMQRRSCELLGLPVIALCETPFYGLRGLTKRAMDVALTIGLLLVLSPLLAAIAIAVKCTSRGPVVFRQRRYGLNGREFAVLKFRTMTVAEDGPQVRQATRNDARITALGRILRRYSLDELPQLFNVLAGHMSLVGPRPHAVAHNEEYRKLVRGYMLRHKILPGITGLAQISGCRGEIASLEDLQARLQYDLEYLRQWSPLLDLKILVQTAVTLFRDDKAY